MCMKFKDILSTYMPLIFFCPLGNFSDIKLIKKNCLHDIFELTK